MISDAPIHITMALGEDHLVDLLLSTETTKTQGPNFIHFCKSIQDHSWNFQNFTGHNSINSENPLLFSFAGVSSFGSLSFFISSSTYLTITNRCYWWALFINLELQQRYTFLINYLCVLLVWRPPIFPNSSLFYLIIWVRAKIIMVCQPFIEWMTLLIFCISVI